MPRCSLFCWVVLLDPLLLDRFPFAVCSLILGDALGRILANDNDGYVGPDSITDPAKTPGYSGLYSYNIRTQEWRLLR